VPQRHAAPAAAPCAELSSPFSPCPAFAPLFSCRIPSPFRRRAPQHTSAGRRPLPHLNPFRRALLRTTAHAGAVTGLPTLSPHVPSICGSAFAL
jgi:hypothetical protein